MASSFENLTQRLRLAVAGQLRVRVERRPVFTCTALSNAVRRLRAASELAALRRCVFEPAPSTSPGMPL